MSKPETILNLKPRPLTPEEERAAHVAKIKKESEQITIERSIQRGY